MPRRTGDPHEVARLLCAGAVALMNTDTLPGLHGRADHEEAVTRIIDIKGRTGDKPMLLLCASTESVWPLVVGIDTRTQAYAETCWPGPFTLILPASPAAPRAATRGRETVALRVPRPSGLRALITAAGGGLISTSVNRAGEPALENLDAAARFCGQRIDVVCDRDWAAESAGMGPSASALIDLTTWPPRLLRAGGEVPPPWEECD